MEMYWFDVIVPTACEEHSGLALKHHQEQKEFSTENAAYKYYIALKQSLGTGGYNYLCKMGKGEFPKDKIFGCKTPNPRKVIGARQ